MPAERYQESKKKTSSERVMIATAVGVFAFAAITLVISRLGVLPLESVIFAALSGFCVGVFIYCERSLIEEIGSVEAESRTDLIAERTRHDALYGDSVTCCVEFDAVTHAIDRASSGLYDILGLDVEEHVRGKHLEDLLGLSATHLETVVTKIREGRLNSNETIVYQASGGERLPLRVSGYYLEATRHIEMMLLPLPDPVERSAAGGAPDDIERVRRGMKQRETRILELKAEVNELLRSSHQAERYSVHIGSEDTKFELDLAKEQGGKK